MKSSPEDEVKAFPDWITNPGGIKIPDGLMQQIYFLLYLFFGWLVQIFFQLFQGSCILIGMAIWSIHCGIMISIHPQSSSTKNSNTTDDSDFLNHQLRHDSANTTVTDHDSFTSVNPATGLPVKGGIDSVGNPIGFDNMHDISSHYD